jgi:hypothetical protein
MVGNSAGRLTDRRLDISRRNGPDSAIEAAVLICAGSGICRCALDFSVRPEAKPKVGEMITKLRKEAHRAGPTR